MEKTKNEKLFNSIKDEYVDLYNKVNTISFDCDLVYKKGFVKAIKVVSGQPFEHFKVRISKFYSMIETLKERDKIFRK